MLPWKETSAESERMRFIELKATVAGTVADLCRWFGISRKTAYKLIGRYEAHGRDGLRDRSRAPHRHANATPRDVAERIVKAKRTHPSWGPKKLVAWLRSGEPDVAWALRPAQRPASWTGPVWSRDANAVAGPPHGASPSHTPGAPTTSGPSTSRDGSVRATGRV